MYYSMCNACVCSNDALSRNQAMEMERNRERFQFLKWGAKTFKNMLIVPPGSGIVHQVRYIPHLSSIRFLVDAHLVS